MRRSLSGGLAGLMTLAFASVASPVQAESDEADTPCQAQIFIDLEPGVSLTPSSGKFHSHGQDGSLTCTGPIAGVKPVAGGTGGAEGRYGVDTPNSCYQLNGKTEFTLSATLPGTAGPIHFVDNVVGEYGPLEGNWIFGGSFHGSKSYGVFKFTPVDSDCFLRPVRSLFIDATAWIVNGKPDRDMATRMSVTR